MNYLITGSRGFIGSHIIRQLRQQGHDVVCICHDLARTSIHEELTPEQIEELTLIQGDLNDRVFLIRTIQEHKIDRIIHLAALLGDAAERDPYEAVRINILGTINIFEAALACGVKRVVWASSQSVFAPEELYQELYHTTLAPNDAVLKATLVYGATKIFDEFLGEWYFKNHGLETIGRAILWYMASPVCAVPVSLPPI